MLLREKTKQKKGYDPMDLPRDSSHQVLIRCNDCGEERWMRLNEIRNIKITYCVKHARAHQGERSAKTLKKNIDEIRLRFYHGAKKTTRMDPVPCKICGAPTNRYFSELCTRHDRMVAETRAGINSRNQTRSTYIKYLEESHVNTR